MATVVYLDVEDEITTAAARIRSAPEARVGLVIPFGSRVATSRINFRLLAREAVAAGRRIDIVAPDASARALAASAGLAAFASVGEFESAVESGDAPAEPPVKTPVTPPTASASRRRGAAAAAAAAGGGGAATAGGASGKGDTPAAAAPTGSGATPAARRDEDAARADGAFAAASRSAASSQSLPPTPVAAESRPHRLRWAAIAGVVIVALALGFGGAAAAILLPSATITVTPVMSAVPPVEMTVRASTAATAVDPSTLVIPAVAVQAPLTAQGDFPATGTSVTQTSASGQVTFDSINTVNVIPIPRGTRVSTLDGVTFATTAAVSVPRATVNGNRIAHGLASVGVAAVAPGPKGNVAAQAIDQVPSSLAALQISVSNAAPTTGGTRTETPKIVAADVSAATAQLAKQLADQMATAVADPALAPQGTTLYPDTAKLGSPTYTPDAASLTGKVLKAGQTTFALKADATATVTAVDEAPLKAMGEAAIRAAVTPGYEIVEDSVQVTVSEGTVGEDGVVSYTVTATALERRPIDANALRSSVLGKTEAEAKAALEPYGRVDVSLSPFWVSAVPDNPDKVTITIAAAERPSATPSSVPTATPAPTPAPSEAPGAASPGASGPAESVPGASPVPSS